MSNKSRNLLEIAKKHHEGPFKNVILRNKEGATTKVAVIFAPRKANNDLSHTGLRKLAKLSSRDSVVEWDFRNIKVLKDEELANFIFNSESSKLILEGHHPDFTSFLVSVKAAELDKLCCVCIEELRADSTAVRFSCCGNWVHYECNTLMVKGDLGSCPSTLR